LHLFTRRSRADLHAADIWAAAADAEAFVLGGDIFDFKWSTHATLEHSLDAAIEWLRELVAPHPQCRFFYVLGNHDCLPAFQFRLDALAHELPNLDWHPYYVRIGSSLFLHGDVADGDIDHEMLVSRRSVIHHRGSKHIVSHLMYDAVVTVRVHRLVSIVFQRAPRVVRRIIAYLDDIGHNAESGVHNVYFGHTHAPLEEYHCGGLVFHNGGAPIKGLKFRIVKAELS